MFFVKLLVFIFFIGGALYCFRKYLLNGSGIQFFIGCNSIAAGEGILKGFIPYEMYLTYNIIRITGVVSLLSAVYLLRRKQYVSQQK